jgi:hypothetical protein
MTVDEAESALRQAIIDHAEAHGLTRDDELLSEYAIIACWQAEIADGRSRYTTQFHLPSVPSHIALGLFSAGEQLVWADCEENE